MDIGRPLGFSESLFCMPTDEGCDSNNTGMLIKLRGAINPDTFKQALHQLYLRHPVFRATYFKESHTHRYFFQYNIEFNDIEIEISDYNSVDLQQGIEKLEESISKLYHPNDALWRAYLLRSTAEDSEHFIVFGFHHAIIDGISQLAVVKDFVKYYQAIDQHQTINQTSLMMTPPVANLLDNKISWEQYSKNYNIIYKRHGFVKELRYEKVVLPRKAKTKIILCDFDEAIVDKIILFSKQLGIKVTALINACLLRAMYRVTGQTETVFQVAVNLRKYTQPRVSDEMIGCYIQGIRVFMKNLDKYHTLEQLAHDYQTQYNDNFNLLYIPPYDFSMQKLTESVHNFIAKTRERFLLGPAISNWGKVSLTKLDGTLKIISIHRGTGRQMGDAPFYLHIATIDSRIQGAFNYAEPYMSQPTMYAIVEEFRKLIIQI